MSAVEINLTTKTKGKQVMKSKNQICKCLAGFVATMAIAGLALLPSSALAQEKGASKLIQLKPIKTVADAEAVAPGDTMVMSCPKCKNTWVTVIEKPAKGGGKDEEKTFISHGCPGCESKIVTEGTGKQAKDVVKHVCMKCGSEEMSCCVIKKGELKTSGMEKK
jgi:hypothetical protein